MIYRCKGLSSKNNSIHNFNNESKLGVNELLFYGSNSLKCLYLLKLLCEFAFMESLQFNPL